MLLKNKLVFVLGASSEIAKHVIHLLQEAGAIVYGSYNQNKPDYIEDNKLFKADLSLKSDIDDLCDFLQGETFYGLINCAGINIAGPLIGLDKSDIDKQVDINLRGPIIVTQAIIKNMIRKKEGSIVHLGSVSAHRFFRGHSIYSASKAGIEGFIKATASEVAKRNVRVNAILPGPVLTPMLQKTIDETGIDPKSNVPMNKYIEPNEIANLCLFLLSNKAPSITGTTIPVDGGYTLW